MVYMDVGPPVRLMAFVTMICATLDVLADIVMSAKLMTKVSEFVTQAAVNASYAYVFFTVVSIFVYFLEMADVVYTLRNGKENMQYARIAKSAVIALEECPLPVCLYILLLYEPIMSVARPAVLVACIKLIALTWGITKFVKLRFCWFCLPLTQSHGWEENTRRCFTPTAYRAVMLLVNVCHITAIIIVICILILATNAQPAVADNVTDYD